ncbi:3-oxoadipate enol-lactonase [Microbacteriaceae bacterium SG_E_30_P1]|uniref:3-oxoadipate enol-lactonase n=1 Tax=Antiquaquibacter oligotrophicus TaxID=2880260 RepID=A0ABT6KR57_9MICO|nr:alpha/beta hydrolase [Antiquaquibacter oligotrophicus]MDH6182461.1 3-oxoadipate enol-lactonase [Antiquaquibacter oligotrophicus]UDF14568.1 alpha/beta hydrolase [Antiquaquibacter oligotrophicus]
MDTTPLRIAGPAGTLAGWIRRGTDPSATPVLFIHPINMQGRIWFDVAERLGPERTLVMPDLRAHGGSSAEGEFGLDAWLDDILAVLDDQNLDSDLHVVGGSLGGSLAVCLAAARPKQVRSIAAIGSSLNFAGADAKDVLDVFDEYGVPGTFEKVFPEITFGPDVDPAVIRLGISLANPNPVEIVKRVWEATVTSDSTPRTPSVRCESLVLTGQFDATCTPALGMHMAHHLRTELTLMPGLGHMPMLEAPDRVGVLLERHFATFDRLHREP